MNAIGHDYAYTCKKCGLTGRSPVRDTLYCIPCRAIAQVERVRKFKRKKAAQSVR